MPGLNWETITGTSCCESEFVEICANCIFMPLVSFATHDKGNTLDNIITSALDYQTHIVCFKN